MDSNHRHHFLPDSPTTAMKVTIGDRYKNEEKNYTEWMKIVGVDTIDNILPNGREVVIGTNDSLTVVVENNITFSPFTTTMEPKDLQQRWEKMEE